MCIWTQIIFRGRMYLKEVHYLGRKLQTNNPFYLIREAKAK